MPAPARGSCPVALGNLLLSQVEDAESRFPVINISREMTTDSEGATFRALQEHNSNKRHNHHQVNDDDNGFHRLFCPGS